MARASHVPKKQRRRLAISVLLLGLAFAAVGARLGTLGLERSPGVGLNMAQPIARGWVRPAITDRNGRVLATDIVMPSAFADPKHIIDVDDAVEKLASVFDDFDTRRFRRLLSDKTRRFVWLRRGLTPVVAQKVHDLGIPGVDFRSELRRVYPSGRLAGHVLGHVDVDNRGQGGIERFLDSAGLTEQVDGAMASTARPVALTLDVGVQHAVRSELRDSLSRYKAKAAAAIVMNVHTGDVLAYASLPDVDANVPVEFSEDARRDRLNGAVFELGSVFKPLTLAMALDAGVITPETRFAVATPLEVGKEAIKDPYPSAQPLSTRQVLLKSSNVGSALIADTVGPRHHQKFFAKLGLDRRLDTELGQGPSPIDREVWDRLTSLTTAYGYGTAVSPLSFAASMAAVVNGGLRVVPRFVQRAELPEGTEGRRVLAAQTSRIVREMLWDNVATNAGTGRRAKVRGYRVGGKTGTAEIAGPRGYEAKRVISSFVAAFPMDAPKYLTYVLVFEPTGVPETGGQITAGRTAAPVSGRIIKRIAPILGVFPASAGG